MTHRKVAVGTGAIATKALLATMAVASLLVTGCGGGGSGGSDAPRAPEVSLTASRTTLTLDQSTTLTWSASADAECTASGGWSGARPTSGDETVTPQATGSVTYTLTCGGATFAEQGTASTTVSVEAPSAYTATALVANAAGTGAVTVDPNVANAWGLALGPTSPLWVANRRNSTSTVYDGNGASQPPVVPLVVRLPPRALGVPFAPTGVVFNLTDEFIVTRLGVSGVARFVFAGESGTLAGWSTAVDTDDAVVAYAAGDGARYTGLAIGTAAIGPVLYAADFANGKIDVFDGAFVRQEQSSTTFAFTDPELPGGYVPFGIHAVANEPGGAVQVYVSYARKDGAGFVVPGAGLGLVNVFDANGVLVRRLVRDGAQLDAPWGMAIAPDDFGTLGGALLVGNSGNGRIHGFDPETGEYVGVVADAARVPFARPGLHGLAFGNDAYDQPHATLFYAAGTNGGFNGEVGRIDLGETAAALRAPAVVAN